MVAIQQTTITARISRDCPEILNKCARLPATSRMSMQAIHPMRKPNQIATFSTTSQRAIRVRPTRCARLRTSHHRNSRKMNTRARPRRWKNGKIRPRSGVIRYRNVEAAPLRRRSRDRHTDVAAVSVATERCQWGVEDSEAGPASSYQTVLSSKRRRWPTPSTLVWSRARWYSSTPTPMASFASSIGATGKTWASIVFLPCNTIGE